MTRVEELVEQVWALSPDDQERVRLLLNLHRDDGPELSPEWQKVIRERLAELDAGTAETLSWDEVKVRLRAKINAAKH